MTMFALRPQGRQVLKARARGQLAKIHLVPLLEPFPSPDLQNLLGRRLGRAIDDLDLHAKRLLYPILAPASVTRIHPQVRKPRQTRASRFEQHSDAVLVWDLRAVHPGFDHETFSRSTSRCRFLPRIFLPPSKPLCSPPTPVVLADCASTIPALGSGSLPSFSLNSRRIVRFNLSQVPSSLQVLK
jgi:hypothetical protein